MIKVSAKDVETWSKFTDEYIESNASTSGDAYWMPRVRELALQVIEVCRKSDHYRITREQAIELYAEYHDVNSELRQEIFKLNEEIHKLRLKLLKQENPNGY